MNSLLLKNLTVILLQYHLLVLFLVFIVIRFLGYINKAIK